jgi:hypothetical protein
VAVWRLFVFVAHWAQGEDPVQVVRQLVKMRCVLMGQDAPILPVDDCHAGERLERCDLNLV